MRVSVCLFLSFIINNNIIYYFNFVFLRPQQIYLFSRHGSRTPGIDQVNASRQFLADYAQYRRDFPFEILRELDSIFVSFNDTSNMGLTPLGASELFSIGERYKLRYPTLFDEQVAVENRMDVLSSEIQRAIDSSVNFLKGLYGPSWLTSQLTNRIRFDPFIMRLFDKTCDRYLADVKNNIDAYSEELKFENGPVMKKLVDDFINRHSLKGMDIKPSEYRSRFYYLI